MAMPGVAIKDRRIFARIPATLSLKYLDRNSNREGIGKTNDISADGIGLLTENDLTAHTPLDIWLQVPDRTEPFYTKGEVVWSKPVEPNKYRVGVCLEKVDLMGLSRVLKTML